MKKVADKYYHAKDSFGIRQFGAETGDIRIVFFPFLGGQSLAFARLARILPKEWELWAIDPPGHGCAPGNLMTEFNQIVDLYMENLEHFFQGNYYFYGHSMGGLIACRMTQYMGKKGNAPLAIFLGASPAPHRIREYSYLGTKEQQELMDILIDHGGVPKQIAQRKNYLRQFMPVIEADVRIFLSTDISRSDPVSCPMTIFFTEEDVFFPSDTVKEWNDYGKDIDYRQINGEHVFIQTHYQIIADHLIWTVTKNHEKRFIS